MLASMCPTCAAICNFAADGNSTCTHDKLPQARMMCVSSAAAVCYVCTHVCILSMYCKVLTLPVSVLCHCMTPVSAFTIGCRSPCASATTSAPSLTTALPLLPIAALLSLLPPLVATTLLLLLNPLSLLLASPLAPATPRCASFSSSRSLTSPQRRECSADRSAVCRALLR
jgi:hypothetical protein